MRTLILIGAAVRTDLSGIQQLGFGPPFRDEAPSVDPVVIWKTEFTCSDGSSRSRMSVGYVSLVELGGPRRGPVGRAHQGARGAAMMTASPATAYWRSPERTVRAVLPFRCRLSRRLRVQCSCGGGIRMARAE